MDYLRPDFSNNFNSKYLTDSFKLYSESLIFIKLKNLIAINFHIQMTILDSF